MVSWWWLSENSDSTGYGQVYDDEMVEGCDTGTSSRVFTGGLTLKA